MPAIAVDAMGGQQAPEALVRGVAEVSLHTDIQCVLVGDATRIQRLLEGVAYNPEHIDIVHAGEVIERDEDPRVAVQRKRDASLLVAMRQVQRGRCAAVVSAGNPAAALAAAQREFALLPGVHNAAIARVYPRQVEQPEQDPLALALDCGATVRCSAEELVQFAVMGSTYARVISKVAAPRVALLNMGRTAEQGDDVLTATHRRLEALVGVNFVGNIEGHQLSGGRADVVVCEGLVGNIVIKLLESVANMAVDLTSTAAAQRNWRWRAGMAIMATGTDRLRALADYASYGGAPILGFDQVCIKAHGRADAQSIANAVKVAAKAARDGLIPALRTALAPAGRP
ncbi:MAG: phosphate acyltransferase PlsX [Candidatus Binatia bacterium]